MHDRLLAAIETLYDCIGDNFDHARALEAYSRTADDTGFMLVEIRPLLGGFATYHSHNIPADAVSAMVKKHDSASTNPLIRDLRLLPERTPVLRRAVSPDDEFRKTAQYRNTCEPWGLHSDGVALFKKGLITTTVCGFCRRPGQSEIDQGLLGLMAVMNAHYCRAMTLQKRLDKLEEALIQSSNILDLIEFGLVLYGTDRTLHFVNAAAQRILDAGDGLRLTKNDLAIGDRSAEERFQALIDAIYWPNMLLSQRSGGIISIPRLSRARPYSLMVVPMQSRNAGMESATAAVFLFDPSTRKTTAIELFVSSYGLSRSEAELAHFLALGGTLEEAAARRGVSRNTVKTQLHSIFAKTDTNRQSELVALLLRSVAGINLQP
jgi:DNA-binding CsgD family transcriptional regulator